jgi:chromosome segregation ATPase
MVKMELSGFWDVLLSGGCGGGASGTVIIYAMKSYLKTLVAENRELRKEITDLKENKISSIDGKINAHIKDDKTAISSLEEDFQEHVKTEASAQIVIAQLGIKLDFINGNIAKLSDKQDSMGGNISDIKTELAKQAANIIADHGYLENLYKSLQEHKNQHAK